MNVNSQKVETCECNVLNEALLIKCESPQSGSTGNQMQGLPLYKEIKKVWNLETNIFQKYIK